MSVKKDAVNGSGERKLTSEQMVEQKNYDLE